MSAVFVALQYFSSLKQQHVARTMTYIDRYESGNVREARQVVNDALRPYAENFWLLDQSGGVSETDRQRIVRSIIDDQPALAPSLDTLIEFYDGLDSCVRGEVCDVSTARRYFGDGRAAEIWDNFTPYIEGRRRNNHRYAEGLQAFVPSGRR